MDFINSFVLFSDNFLTLKIIGSIEIFHILYFLIVVRGIHKIYNIIGG